MQISLRINNQLIKAWPVELPPHDPSLSELENFNQREAHVQAMLAGLKQEYGVFLIGQEAEWSMEVKAFIQPKDITIDALYRFNQIVDKAKEPAPVINIMNKNLKQYKQ